MLTRFLFWNVQGKPLAPLVAAMAAELAVDVVVLAECAADDPTLCEALTAASEVVHRPYTPFAGRLRVYGRLPTGAVQLSYADPNGRFGMYRLVGSEHDDVLLAAIHYPSRRNWSPEDQNVAASSVSRILAQQEGQEGHQRTLVVGDFNMNPFDAGMVAAHGFHAVATRRMAACRTRTVDGQRYDLFYNPMWRFFGDDAPGPPGTHWYRPAKPVVFGWNIYDQVLLRPDLMGGLRDLRIVERVGAAHLYRNGKLIRRAGSDHLPLYFALDL